MKIPFIERRTSVKEKYSSRKYRTVLFWNVVTVLSIVLQSFLSYKGVEVKLPLEIITGIAGILNGEYLGVNILEKKFLKDNPLAPNPSTTPTTEQKK